MHAKVRIASKPGSTRKHRMVITMGKPPARRGFGHRCRRQVRRATAGGGPASRAAHNGWNKGSWNCDFSWHGRQFVDRRKLMRMRVRMRQAGCEYLKHLCTSAPSVRYRHDNGEVKALPLCKVHRRATFRHRHHGLDRKIVVLAVSCLCLAVVAALPGGNM